MLQRFSILKNMNVFHFLTVRQRAPAIFHIARWNLLESKGSAAFRDLARQFIFRRGRRELLVVTDVTVQLFI
jgi:hypothetical protein